MKKRNGILATLILYFSIFAVAFTGGYLGMSLSNGSLDGTSDSDNLELTKTNTTTKAETDLTEVSAKCKESVVEIKTETMTRDRFYGNYVSEGAGSGVIISKNGYIITNYHVVDGATTIYVTLTNGKEYEATYIGGDAENDIAVLRINANNLTAATIGDSDALVEGEDVIAIGNPLGELGGTVTEGIISSTSREITIDGVKMDLLQTSAAINPGNSGGGLFNMDGELVGVVNAKSSGSEIEGLGFAIPVSTAIEAAEAIIANAK